MTASTDSGSDQVLQPREQSLLRSSMLMASGTMVSRVLGFIRSALLVAAIGVSLGAADAFGAANTLPNNIYNLLAAGVFDAVLIPQIVRALKRKNGSVYVNRLLTAAGTILFLLTVVSMIAAPLLISVFASGFPPEVRALAITFSLWCLPQIFFYGVYNLLGELLNARGIFGPYMWAPVVNNIIAIAGLSTFLVIWGRSPRVFPATSFTGQQLWVLAGSATLGVMLQALVLLIPMRHSGVKLRLDFHFKGTDFGSVSKVAGWTFATLMISQLGVLSTTNIASQATKWGEAHQQVIATLPAYNMAFMLYMVPQSLISVTLATAIFTRLANNVAEGNHQAVARDYHTGVRLIMMLTLYAVAVMMVAALPIMQIIMPTFLPEEASLYGTVLVALALGIPSTGIILMSQRVFFAFENAKPVFLMGVVPTLLQIVVGWSIFFLADATWWTAGASMAETVCRVVQGFIAVFWTAHLVRSINAGRVIAQYILYFLAFTVSALIGWGLLHLISPLSGAQSSMGRMVDSLWRVILVALVVGIVYLLSLRIVDPEGFTLIKRFVVDRLPARFRKNVFAAQTTEGESKVSDINGETNPAMPEEPLPDAELPDVKSGGTPGTDDSASLTSAGAGIAHQDMPGTNDVEVPATPAMGIMAKISAAIPIGAWLKSTFGADVEARPDSTAGDPSEVPSFDDIMAGEYASQSLAHPLRDTDPATSGQIPILYGSTLPSIDAESAGSSPAGMATDRGTPKTPEHGIHGIDTSIPRAVPYTSSGRGDAGAPSGFVSAGAAEPSGHTPTEPRAAGSPRKHSLAFNPTVPMLGIGVVVVVVGLVFSFHTLTSQPQPLAAESGLVQSGDQSGQSGNQSGQSGEGGAPAPEQATEPAVAAPVISSITVSSWGNDGLDHPELSGALTDGDPSTLWYTRYYDLNQFSESDAIALLVKFDSEATVTQIKLSVAGEGGELVVRASTGDDPRTGEVLATTTLSRETVVTLPEPRKLSELGLVFMSLPTDDEGLNRAQISSLSVN